MALTEKEKKELARLSNPDYGIPGAGFDSLRTGVDAAPLPGTNSTLDFLNTARQFMYEAAKEKRLDDGFRGTRGAKVLHVEVKPFISIPDKLFVKNLIAELPEEDRDANLNEIFVIYAIPTGGIAATCVVPDSLATRESPALEKVDLGKIINYPRFYAFKKQINETQISPGDFINVEVRDYVEYSFGVFVSLHASAPMITGGDSPSPRGETVGALSKYRPAKSGAKPFPDSGPRAQYSVTQFELDNSGASIGLASTGPNAVRCDPIPDAMAAVNGATAGASKYGAIYQPLRADIAPHMLRVVNEIREQGAKFYGCGAFMKPEWRKPFAKIKKTGCPISNHYLGRAIDLHTGTAVLTDSKAQASLRKAGYNVNKTPAYAYYVANNGARRWEVWAVSDDPTVPEVEITAVFAGWGARSDIFCEKVRGRMINLSKIMAKHGFRVIRAHSGLTPRDNIDLECRSQDGNLALSDGGKKTKFTSKWKSSYSHLEWWHFQFTGDLVKGTSTYSSQLKAVWSLEDIKKRWGVPAGVSWWTSFGKGRPWDDPQATYLEAWG